VHSKTRGVKEAEQTGGGGLLSQRCDDLGITRRASRRSAVEIRYPLAGKSALFPMVA
jgi:hypothetical protein